MGLEDMVTSVTGADTIIILRVMVVLCGVILFSASVPFSEAKHWKFIKKNPDILDDNLMNILFYEKGFLDKKIKTEILRGIVLAFSSLIGILFTLFEVNQIMDAGRVFYILSSYLVIAYTIRCIVDSLGWIFSIKDIKQRYASNSDGMKKLQGFMKRNSVSTLIQSAFGIAVSILLLLQISSPA
ncbi:hypothetical protein E4H54_22620 [Salmonella enterica]|uniref:Uncharacterized protein n=3 Tax=Enterobacterales TaxID=91347 RepID=A0ABD7PDQ9_KLEVA|nr:MULTISPECIES: hypothetical protein [Enterobacteriaceae]EAO9031968.1 hypothetical protein [Salmonella enterica]ECP8399148.1 hypothetical protein [Salmonella enterica subsp. enterica serovar Matopeni]EDB1765298.1 hypothetical protein [Salmonella enterica subsp. enterica serovar Brancaster]EDM3423384.1 hypothetical protein [Salmonella enterica subsp. enterica serovar Newport]EDS4597682.1 hypothetical protein [Salmonella enterica subsp. enterica serovar Javiana]EDX8006219.1 hypothetical protei